ncbi:MAG: hypothetical protein Q7Q73_04410 [Verrucomicrobiota bacterium JB024]|nr:hypothetical protein [Verrucomicrobiota bacterium JB024]
MFYIDLYVFSILNQSRKRSFQIFLFSDAERSSNVEGVGSGGKNNNSRTDITASTEEVKNRREPILTNGRIEETLMSIKMMKKAMIAAVGAAALAGAGAAQAVTITPGPGPYTFSGSSALSAFGINANCTLELTGTVTNDGTNTTITVTGGDVIPGDSTCNLVGLDGFPWTATVANSSAPTGSDATLSVNFTGVEVTALGIPCTSSPATVPAVFSYVNPTAAPSVDPASFSFATAIGSCSVNGNLADTSATLQVTNP